MKYTVAPANYSFNASAKTITFSGLVPSDISNILHVANITRGVIYFQPQAGLTFSGTYASPVLTLTADTTGHTNTDKLLIVYDDASGIQEISAASLPLPTGAATQTTLASVDGKLPALDTGYMPVLVKNGQLEVTNDTGNPLPVGPAAQLNVTGSASANNTDLISVACNSYRSVSFQITGTWSGTVTYQVSNDNTNWVAANVIAANGTAAINSSTANTLAYGALVGFQYFRARFTAYTSGTASINAYFNRDPVPTATLPVSPSSPTNTITASSTSPGGSVYTVNSAASTNAAVVKSTAGNIYSITAMNASAATKYVRFYNKATTPTVGTDIPIVVVAIPATSSKEFNYTPAVRFGTGIGVSITGGAAAADATAVAAGDVQLLVYYA